MEETKNRRIGSRQGKDGIPVGRSFASPTKDTRRAELVVPPNVVVPILFVPGIMGSNLRNRTTEESVWNASTLLSLAWQWAFRSAKTRQTKLNPDVTEADPEGKIPKVADYAGDDGKPDDLDEAQLRERGWGTVSNYGYGEFMAWLEPMLNKGNSNPWVGLVGGKDGSGDEENDPGSGEGGPKQPTPAPEGWGAQKDFSPLSAVEANDAWGARCPLYGVGYNWLQSNGKSGVDLATRIDEAIAEWRDKEVDGKKLYRCDRVILVTHSMGGLVSRAAVHADYGNAADRTLGICHGVMPADGAAASYHHVRSGYNGFSRFVLGKDAAQVTAIFAQSCGPLELLPSKLYGLHWLKVVERRDSAEHGAFALPNIDPYDEIYAKRDQWYRLIDPELIDPGKKASSSKAMGGAAMGPWVGYVEKLLVAKKFHTNTGETYHSPTYAHYGADAARGSYLNIVWSTAQRIFLGENELLESEAVNARGWEAIKLAFTLGKDNSDPVRLVQGNEQLVFEIADPAEPGDDTVPENSGAGPFIRGGGNVRQSLRLEKMSEGHAGSYDDKNIRDITLYSIAKIIADKEAS